MDYTASTNDKSMLFHESEMLLTVCMGMRGSHHGGRQQAQPYTALILPGGVSLIAAAARQHMWT